MKKVYVAGGCFWGVQGFFKTIAGVTKTTVGYANSKIDNPIYEQVKTQNTNAVEAVEIFYDEKITSLEKIVEALFSVIDPTALNYQGPDYGTQYRNGIYYVNQDDKAIIENKIAQLSKNISGKVVTEILELKNYFLAEEYHQDFTDKHPNIQCHIKF
ncbi:peptide-methionine (S)-S-oxide reductase MsrA [Mycoplasmopsis alligatoris]|uniref:Peptide methionine sulfoxide reductase MsrA n=1 Tax=Mycoplasmopsis alligatoris A21JP2 TaxID=747682 RepID=D4XVU9_9BACT|nr:peptide-methionine (S)-S-oxide reductase MsrA [Mycoplasmopsis alligatoris]EFF41532.1 peptide-methionine (S)-S-oxide reductase [Mycoplasmopsis alligatoris A21JP2]